MAGEFQAYKDKNGEFRFRFKASSGQPIASSEGYSSTAPRMNAIQSVQENAAGAADEAHQRVAQVGDALPAQVDTPPTTTGRRWLRQFCLLAIIQFGVTLTMVFLTFVSDTDVTRMHGNASPELESVSLLLISPVVTSVYPDLKADSGKYRYVLFVALTALNSLVWAAVIVVALRILHRVARWR